MRMRDLLPLMLGAVLFAASCSKTDNLIPAADQQAKQEQPAMKQGPKPFSGSMVYQVSTAFDLTCNCDPTTTNFYYNLLGSGTLSHLGLSTSKIKPCITLTSYGFHVANECGSFVAANGDELYTTVSPYDLNFNPSTGFSGTLHVTFAGGTGRFTTATGSFDATLSIDFSNVATLIVTSGAINY